MYFILILRIILYIFTHEIHGDDGRIYQIKIYKTMLTLINSLVATLYLLHRRPRLFLAQTSLAVKKTTRTFGGVLISLTTLIQAENHAGP